MRNTVAKKLRKLAVLYNGNLRQLKRQWNDTPRPDRHKAMQEVDRMIAEAEKRKQHASTN